MSAVPQSARSEIAVFVTRRDGGEVLLLRRVRSGGGYWHVVAGALEPGESAREAAVRELQEETGLVAPLDGELGIVEYADRATLLPAHPSTSRVAVPITCFRAAAPADWEPLLEAEHDAHRWSSPPVAADALVWPETAQALRTLCAR